MMKGMKQELKDLAEVVYAVQAGMDHGFERLNTRMDNIETRLVPIERRLTNIEEIVADIRNDLDASLAATDKHAIQLFDHDKRIGRLEKRVA